MKKLEVFVATIVALLWAGGHAYAQWNNGVGASPLVNSTLTGSMFSDDAPPAIISRIADRVLVGGAVITDGKRFPVVKTWVGNYAPAGGFLTYFDSRSAAEVINQRGGVAIAAASRTSDMNPADTGSIGNMSVVLNDYLDVTPNNRRSAWGNYLLAVRAADTSTTGTGGTGGVASTTFTFSPIPGTAPTSGSGITGTGFTQGTWITAYNAGTGVATLNQNATVANGTTVTYAASGGAIAGGIQGIELDVANLGSVIDVDPYGGGNSQAGLTPGLLVSSGGEVGQSGTSVNPASAGVIVANNHGQFRKGIVIGSNAITGTDGQGTGTAPAVVMARGHEIQWRYAAGDTTPALGGVIRSDNNNLNFLTKALFTTNGLRIVDQFENQIFRVQPAQVASGDTVNYVAIINQKSGTGNATLAGTGADTNAGVDLQGNARAQFGFYNQSKARLIFRVNDPGTGTTTGNLLQANAADTGGVPALVTVGNSDANIDLGLTPKGTGSIVANAQLKLKSFTVATLPTCNAGLQDALAVATDTTAPTYNGSLTGGGAVRIPVYCNGTAWTAH